MKETCYIFADDEFKNGYGLPKLHFRTPTINLTSDWTTLASFLKNRRMVEDFNPVYKVPPELKSAKGLRDLTVTEIEKWEAEMKEKNNSLEKKI